MRYFFFSSNPEPSLAGSVVVPAPGCREVSPCCAVQAVLASESGALTGAVVVSSITVTTDKDLAPAAGTEVVAGTEHRHAKADEGWIYTCSGATLWTGCAKARFGAWRRF